MNDPRLGLDGPNAKAKPNQIKRLLLEALHGQCLVVIHIEHRHELGDLQHLFEFRPKIAQLQGASLRARAVECRHERPQTGAVDVRYIRHVQHDVLMVVGQQAFHPLPEGIALLTQDDPSVQIHGRDPAYFPFRHSQCHVIRLLADSISISADSAV